MKYLAIYSFRLGGVGLFFIILLGFSGKSFAKVKPDNILREDVVSLGGMSFISVAVNSGEIINEHRSEDQLYPASLTKLMTLYLVFEALETKQIKMQDKLKISKRASRMPASKLYLVAGKQITVQESILALIVKSANDVAVVIAEALGQSEGNFVAMMNRKAKQLDMQKTQFMNSSGLHNDLQYTTARDIARLSLALKADFPQYYYLFASKEFDYAGKTYFSTNSLLLNYPGATGLKTGYTKRSGYNLVTTVERDGVEILAVLLGHQTSELRDDVMVSLMNLSYIYGGV